MEGVSVSYFQLSDINHISGSTNHRFNSIVAEWEKADGIIFGTPVYTYGPPSYVYELIENIALWRRTARNLKIKPIGFVVQGGGAYNGAEITCQVLLNLCLSVGCTPISGDMPGFSQGVIGQITDQGEVDSRLLEGVRRLAVRVLEMAQIFSLGEITDYQPINLLGVLAGTGNEEIRTTFIKTVFSKAQQHYGSALKTKLFDFNNSTVSPCMACSQYCARDFECFYHDGMQEFRQLWLNADGILWAANSESSGIDTKLVAAIDRMNQIRFESFFNQKSKHMSRFLKVVCLFDFNKHTDLSEITTQFIQNSSLLYQNILLPEDGCRKYHSPIDKNGDLWDDNTFNSFTNHFIGNIARLKTGVVSMATGLSDEYFPSRHEFTQIDRCPG